MHFATLEFSDHEIEKRCPDRETVDRAVELFTEHGAVRLHRCFQATEIAAYNAHFRRHYRRNFLRPARADGRPLFTVHVEGPLNSPTFYANPLIFPIITRLLGDDCILGATSCVLSFPGAVDQFIHRDTQSLFDDFAYDVRFPAYALTVLIALVDVTTLNGCTRLWPGSHRNPSQDAAIAAAPHDPELAVGSVMLTDSRLVHRGAANRSSAHRPLLYNTYHRSWLRDYGGYEHRQPVVVPLGEWPKVPAEYRQLFAWMRTGSLPRRMARRAAEIVVDVAPVLDRLPGVARLGLPARAQQVLETLRSRIF